MNKSYNTIAVDYPNIQILPRHQKDIPYGQFLSSSTCNSDTGTITFRDLYLPNFSIRVTEGKYDHDAVFYNASGDGLDLMGSCLFLKGHFQSMKKRQTEGVFSYTHTQNFKYDPNNEIRHVFPGSKPFHIIHFSYTTESIAQFLPEDECWSRALTEKIRTDEGVLGQQVVQIIQAQERALDMIFDNPLSGSLGVSLMETAAMQIVLLQLSGLFRDTPPVHAGFTRRDIEIIHALRDYLSKTFLEDHSMCKLSKEFGVNTNKLMSAFKKVFGKSIFGYITELRMEHARELLHDDLMVTEVARTLGYKNANHFSSAFKRHFGVNPSHQKMMI